MRYLFRSALFVLLPLATIPPAALAQDSCGMGGCTAGERTETAPISETERRLSEQEVFVMASEIMAVTGLRNTFKIEETMDVYNAAAYLEDQERWIGFNPLWVRQFKDLPTDDRWPLYAVIAHEIGHHLMGHTILPGGSRPATELEADEYAGFVLHALGADLEDAQRLWHDFSAEASASHPGRGQRLAAVSEGWHRSAGRAGLALPVATAPAPDADSPQSIRQRDEAASEAPSRATDVIAETRRPELPGQAVCAPLPKGGLRGRLCASSAVAVDHVARLTDGDRRAPWTEQDPGAGAGSRLLFEFARPISAQQLTIVNGDNSDEKAFRRNARLEGITLRGSNGHSRVIVVRDNRREQSWTLAGFEGVEWIEVTVDSVIEGRRYDTLAVSRLRIE
ncbi:NADase-type glycan-binding domain-containing protein [Jannaschia marina]|uniref:NADase-type glycan-binding domain-containing protein n=1 Tax=Jannaschia marina TaxID=2741674 RepID=UPI0015CDF549|nr:hypothetical protein [Jannaschia marina]